MRVCLLLSHALLDDLHGCLDGIRGAEQDLVGEVECGGEDLLRTPFHHLQRTGCSRAEPRTCQSVPVAAQAGARLGAGWQMRKQLAGRARCNGAYVRDESHVESLLGLDPPAGEDHRHGLCIVQNPSFFSHHSCSTTSISCSKYKSIFQVYNTLWYGMNRGSLMTPPAPANSPTFGSGSAKSESSQAKMTSHARAVSKPPP